MIVRGRVEELGESGGAAMVELWAAGGAAESGGAAGDRRAPIRD